MGGDRNTVHLLTRDGDKIEVDIKIESWPAMTKEEVATALVARVARTLTAKTAENPS
jgi:phosphopantothenoylcysteine decarboxylase/phosphopantothenate--cysteine ligase